MTTFKQAVEAAPSPVNEALRPELQALDRDHRRKVSCPDACRLTGSIDLDEALRPIRRYAQAPRWDYGIGYKPPSGNEHAVWIEVHKAETGEVSAVLSKLQWLRDWLGAEAPALRRLAPQPAAGDAYVWIAAGKIHIPRNAPQRRRLSQHGLKLALRLSLD